MLKLVLIFSGILFFYSNLLAQLSESEPNNFFSEANIFPVDTIMSGTLAPWDDNTDWYKIEIPVDGKLTFIANSGSGISFYQMLTDTDSTYQVANSAPPYDQNDTLIHSHLQAGIYYLRIKIYGGSGDSYTVKSSFEATPKENDTEANDLFEEAPQLVIGNNTTGHLGHYHDKKYDNTDYFKVITPYDGKLTVIGAPDSTLNIILILRDSDGLYSISHTGSGTNILRGENDTLIHNKLSAGTYYLQVDVGSGTGTFGSYSLSTIFTSTTIPEGNDIEPNNTQSEPEIITIDSLETGHLGFFGDKKTDDVDFFKIITSNVSNLKIVAEPDNTLNTNLFLYNDTGSSLNSERINGEVGKNDTLIHNDLPAGTIFLKVGIEDLSYGSYKLRIYSDGIETNVETNVETIKQNNTNVFPNPFNNQIIVNSLAGIKTISITNVLGEKFMIKKNIGKEQYSLTTSNLLKGTYFLQIEDNEGKCQTHKIIKQ